MNLGRLLMRWLSKAPQPGGRPPGSGRWANSEDFEQALQIAIEALEAKGRRATQEDVSRILFCHPRTLRRWISEFDLDWTKLTRKRSLSRKL
jgi:hypothetical protein